MYRVVVTEKHFGTFFCCVEKEKHILKESAGFRGRR